MKCKILEYIIDKIETFYYRITAISIRRFWGNIKRWLSYYSICRTIYDCDYTSILTVERHQIERVRNLLAKYSDHINWEHDVSKMNLALRLLDIIEEDGCSERVGKPLEFEPCPDNPKLSRIVPDQDAYWTLPFYVNTRNSKRFWDFDQERFNDPHSGNLWKDHLRVQKAWYLYYKLRYQYTHNWWT